MFTLNYEISEKSRELNGLHGYDLSNISLTDLHYSDLFTGNLIVKNETTDLSAGWGWIPILHAAQTINDISKNLVDNYQDEYEFTENSDKLLFNCTEGAVRITATYAEGEIAVSYEEFKVAAGSFLSRSLAEFCSIRPEAASSPVLLEIERSI